jgi:predicted dehydrogenase
LNIQFGHYVDALCLCAGEIQEVSGVVSTQVKEWYFTDLEETMEVTAPDNVLVSGKLANGAVVSVHVAAIPWHGSGGPTMSVYGRDGTLVYHGSHIDHTRLEGARGNEDTLQEISVPERLVWVPEGVPQGPPFNVAQMYRRLADAIRTGGPVEPDFDFAVRRHKLLTAIEKASDEGRSQTLE